MGESACTACEACVNTCKEDAVTLDHDIQQPVINTQRCIACGQCIPVCPTGTLTDGAAGYRIQLGGKLGRHPQLAREMPGIYAAADTLAIVAACVDIYKAGSRRGERFGDVLKDADFRSLTDRFGPGALDRQSP